MDKYGVKTDDKMVKTAGEDKLCPECGAKVRREGSVIICPNCGTKPFEAEDGKEEKIRRT